MMEGKKTCGEMEKQRGGKKVKLQWKGENNGETNRVITGMGGRNNRKKRRKRGLEEEERRELKEEGETAGRGGG